MKNFKFLIVLLPILLFSCTKDDIPAYASKCKILKSELAFASDEISFYDHEYVYKNNLLVARINFGNSVSASTGQYVHGEVSRDSLVYDDLRRVSQIYELPAHNNISYRVSEFIYDSPMNSRPSKRLQHYFYSDTLFSSYEENISYKDGRISKTEVDYVDDQYSYSEMTTYSYDGNGNLLEKHYTYIYENSISETITTYDDYDNKKNPFREFPLLDYFGIAESPNNYTSYTVINQSNGINNGHHSKNFVLDYNKRGYPKIGEYDCK